MRLVSARNLNLSGNSSQHKATDRYEPIREAGITSSVRFIGDSPRRATRRSGDWIGIMCGPWQAVALSPSAWRYRWHLRAGAWRRRPRALLRPGWGSLWCAVRQRCSPVTPSSVCSGRILVNVGLTAVWTSSAPSVATSEGTGLFVAKSDGQTTLTATYSGQSLSAPLTVHLQDALTASAAASRRHFQSWHHRDHVVARGLWRGVRGLRQTDARYHGSSRCGRQHERTTNTAARRRQIPHLHHVHPAAWHDACVSDGRPSDRVRHADRGSGGVTCTLC